MSEAAKEAVRRTWAAFDAADAEAFAASVAPDWRERRGDGATATLADALEAIARYAQTFEGTQTMLEQLVAEGDLVAVRTTTRTTHCATGRALTRYEIAIHRVADGRVAETWSEGGSPPFEEA